MHCETLNIEYYYYYIYKSLGSIKIYNFGFEANEVRHWYVMNMDITLT